MYCRSAPGLWLWPVQGAKPSPAPVWNGTTENSMTKHILIGIALLGLAACETAKGAGRDINKAGTAIEQAASDVQKKL